MFLWNLCQSAAEPFSELERVSADVFCCDFLVKNQSPKELEPLLSVSPMELKLDPNRKLCQNQSSCDCSVFA
jgi:hypothetical protein